MLTYLDVPINKMLHAPRKKNLWKKFQKFSKNFQKFSKFPKKFPKNFQKNFQKISKKFQKFSKNFKKIQKNFLKKILKKFSKKSESVFWVDFDMKDTGIFFWFERFPTGVQTEVFWTVPCDNCHKPKNICGKKENLRAYKWRKFFKSDKRKRKKNSEKFNKIKKWKCF